MSKLWGGRFAQQTDALVHRLNASIPFDRRLYREDIDGSIAWAAALELAGIITASEASQLQEGLRQVLQEFEGGSFELLEGDEDIHTAVERRLTELVGDVGGKLHTGRSRNDQIATDFRLWCMRAAADLQDAIRQVQTALLDSATAQRQTLLPGYTHLQHAQVVSWAHWALSHFWPLQRDMERVAQARERMATLPLGSGALAGTAYNIDRQKLAESLGFKRISENSMDAVSDRDFAADFLYCGALIGLHLSRIAEQLILFSSREFSFVRLSDAYSTGSSLMPQKKNPDTLELTRGKSGRLIGNLNTLLIVLKGLPSTYDKDLQEDKEPIFDTFDTLMLTLPVLAGTIETIELCPEQMRGQLEAGLLATDLADYLVQKGVPFRTAHHIVGQVVRKAELLQRPLDALDLETMRQISSHFEDDVMACFDFERSLAARAAYGGTAPEALEQQLSAAHKALESGGA